ncbi:MAG: helix-turn-helix domain-containing protein [Actinobacteria bacterium]|nr:helix-turn-helix domain-containing protein [Actinomycetota bacterium]
MTASAIRTSSLPEPAPDVEVYLREQLSNVRGLLALSMLMTERRHLDEILHLATTAIPALVAARAVGVHVPFGDGARWHAMRAAVESPANRADILSQLQRLPRNGGPLQISGEPWAWAFGLPSPVDQIGTLIVAADTAPSDDDMLVLRSLAQQTGIALANARLHASHKATNDQLSETVAALRHTTAIHDRFTQVALAGGGYQGVVDALFELTGLPAAIEDGNGHVIASASPLATPVRRAVFNTKREALIQGAATSGRPMRAGDRLLTVVRPHPDVVGVLMLVDPSNLAGRQEEVALEHGVTVLAIELACLHGLAETELRLGRNLVADLLQGQPDDAVARAQALGHDLHRPHRVVVLSVDARHISADDALLRVRETLSGGLTARPGAPSPLLMQSGHAVVALVTAKAADSDLLASLQRDAGRKTRIGVGGVCRSFEDFPRSYREAQVALRLAQSSRDSSGIMRYDDLGVYQLLSEVADPRALDTFVRTWLGTLIDYDVAHGSDLIATLTTYLDVGGNYDTTARTLTIGRSTVRYRIRRIQELSGLDLSDPDTRFQLQLAARAWATINALTAS